MYKRFNARGVAYTVNREYDSKLMVGASIDLTSESVSLCEAFVARMLIDVSYRRISWQWPLWMVSSYVLCPFTSFSTAERFL
jgi:hypothetical protein